jgi:predicted DNA-binding transcriptional regulator AlpA
MPKGPASPSPWVPAPDIASEFQVTLRSVYNWIDDPVLNFPRPRSIHKNLYFVRDEIEAWKASRPIKAARQVYPMEAAE